MGYCMSKNQSVNSTSFVSDHSKPSQSSQAREEDKVSFVNKDASITKSTSSSNSVHPSKFSEKGREKKGNLYYPNNKNNNRSKNNSGNSKYGNDNDGNYKKKRPQSMQPTNQSVHVEK